MEKKTIKTILKVVFLIGVLIGAYFIIEGHFRDDAMLFGHGVFLTLGSTILRLEFCGKE